METIHVHIHDDRETTHILRRIESNIAFLKQQGVSEMAEIDDLIAAVAAEKTVDDSAVALLTTLTGQINTLVQNATDLATLKTQITGVTSSVAANTQELSDAVVANTPAAPPSP
jgi:hypothetical protein